VSGQNLSGSGRLGLSFGQGFSTVSKGSFPFSDPLAPRSKSIQPSLNVQHLQARGRILHPCAVNNFSTTAAPLPCALVAAKAGKGGRNLFGVTLAVFIPPLGDRSSFLKQSGGTLQCRSCTIGTLVERLQEIGITPAARRTMVATADIGRVAPDCSGKWTGRRVVELEGRNA